MLLDRPPYRLASIGPRLLQNPLGEVEPPIAFIARARPFPNTSAGFRCTGSNAKAHKKHGRLPQNARSQVFFGLRRERSRENTFIPRFIPAFFNTQNTQVAWFIPPIRRRRAAHQTSAGQERPQNRSYAAARHRTTKPSRGWVRIQRQNRFVGMRFKSLPQKN